MQKKLQKRPWNYKKIQRGCLYCRKTFLISPSGTKIGRGKYCSSNCFHKSTRGRISWNKGLTIKDDERVKRFVEAGQNARMGKSPWNKGKTGLQIGWNKGKRLSDKHKDKLSISHRTNNYLKKMGGENNPSWRGGITPINNQIRGSLEYKLWEDSVKNRDGNCCQKCEESRTSKIMAHHILNFSSHVELRFAIDNGITFCRPCHKEFHKKYGYKKNTREQIREYVTN